MGSTGSGADMMKRVAAPLVGGLVTSFALELLVYPAIYAVWKWRFVMKRGAVDVSKLDMPSLGGRA
jgi:Cu(I)/Ag(I) efflux system membrane protein CusA/SilA